ncbi:MAG: hypothetical protein JSW60_05765 [Thermoplasmatales archaeon]|nr:MAG: hypothetical protein JSW60_05765 [Thermoplasmatales archaeon]
MVECEECGTKLGILEGYRHPTMGKKHLLCSPCFDQVSESVEKWGEFVLSNSFNMGASKSNSQQDWENMLTSFNQIQNMFDNFWQKKKSV